MNKLGNSFSSKSFAASLQAEQFRLPDGMTPEDQTRQGFGFWPVQLRVQFQPEQQLSERILFPATPSQTQTASRTPVRCFQNDDVLTSTMNLSPLRCKSSCRAGGDLDFPPLSFITLNGPAAQNKAWPSSQENQCLYAMLSRQDNENIYLMFSDNVHF